MLGGKWISRFSTGSFPEMSLGRSMLFIRLKTSFSFSRYFFDRIKVPLLFRNPISDYGPVTKHYLNTFDSDLTHGPQHHYL